jgi:hypothetical protein
MIRLCYGKSRLKAEAGMVPIPEGKGERGRKPVQFNLAGEKRHIFKITILIIRQPSLHHFGIAFLYRSILHD